MNKATSNLSGILWMIVASLLLSIMAIIVSKLAHKMHIYQLSFLGSFISLVLISLYKIFTGSSFKTDTVGYYLVRGLLCTITTILWFTVLKSLPVTEATAIGYITPLLNIMAGVVILKERITMPRASAIMVGFVGAVIVLHPGFKNLDSRYLVALATLIIWTSTDLLAKIQIANDHPAVHCFYLNLCMCLFFLPLAIYCNQPFSATNPLSFAIYDLSHNIQMSLDLWLWVLVMGIAQLLNLLTFLQAYYHADMAVVSPYDFCRVIFTSLFAYFFFDETMSYTSIIGLGLLFGSILYLTKLEVKTRS